VVSLLFANCSSAGESGSKKTLGESVEMVCHNVNRELAKVPVSPPGESKANFYRDTVTQETELLDIDVDEYRSFRHLVTEFKPSPVLKELENILPSWDSLTQQETAAIREMKIIVSRPLTPSLQKRLLALNKMQAGESAKESRKVGIPLASLFPDCQ
jgi:hypothetical protein